MAVMIIVETPLQDDVREMVAAFNAYLRPLCPPQYQFQLTVEEMAEPSVSLFVARTECHEAVGMGALKTHGGGLGEIKRMYTVQQFRRRGIGAALTAINSCITRNALSDGILAQSALLTVFDHFGVRRTLNQCRRSLSKICWPNHLDG
jgi:putative acetyltransferase